MRKLNLFLSTLIIANTTLAGLAHQTDWAGGGGIQGPVISWDDQFYIENEIGFSKAGDLGLLARPMTPIEHPVAVDLSLPDAVDAVDIDGDGDDDIIGAFWSADAVYWFENFDGQGSDWIPHLVDTQDGPRDICAADFDEDGDLDILGAIHYGNRLIWWENHDQGSSWTTHIIDSYLRSCTAVRAVDMDADGDVDALATGVNVSGDLVVWWENNASGSSWIEHIITTDPYYPRGLHHADIDGDEDVDVAIAAWNDSEISWWENTDGTATAWTKHSVDNNFSSAYTVHCADMDGDEDIDLLGGSAQSDQFAWWENTDSEGGAWTKHLIDTSSASAHYITAADVDLDGDLDCLGASYSDNKIAWWENNGNGTSWTEHVISNNCSNADMVRVGDFDGNGTLDAVGAAYGSGRVDWWEIVEYVDSGSLTSSILDIGESQEPWNFWGFDATLPDVGTQVMIEARAANDFTNMGNWIVIVPGDLSTYLSDGLRYLQYRLSLSTQDNHLSPNLSAIHFTWGTTTSSPPVAEPRMLSLSEPYPNPFNPRTTIQFEIAQTTTLHLAIYDLSGRRLRTLLEAQILEAGGHEIVWDGCDDSGASMSSGVYLCRISGNNNSETRAVVLLK
jgi:hypothetical protein